MIVSNESNPDIRDCRCLPCFEDRSSASAWLNEIYSQSSGPITVLVETPGSNQVFALTIELSPLVLEDFRIG